MSRSIRIFSTVVFGAAALMASAQYDQEIISIGDRELTVDQAFKIGELPSTIDTTTSSYQMTYETIPRQVEVNYEVKPIKAAKLKVMEPLTKLYKGYVKGGIGMYTSPLLEFRYNGLRSRDWAFGIGYDHFSSNGGLNNLANSSYSDNEVDLWARKYLKKHTLQVGLGYERNVNHYYGFDPLDEEIDKKDIEQRYSTVGFDAALQSYYRDSSKVNHRIEMAYRNTSSIDAQEGNFILGAQVSKYEGIYKFGLDGRFDVNALTNSNVFRLVDRDLDALIPTDSISSTNTIIDISPSIKTQKEDLTAEVGIGIVTDGEDGTRFRFYPRAYVSYSLFDDLFTPYAGMTGHLKRNSLYSISRENPFILPAVELKNTSTNLDLYGGIRGTIINDLSFNAKASYSTFDDFAFFINDTVLSRENAFQVVYDDMKALAINGELSYKKSDHFTITTGLKLTTYTADELEKAFNLPSVEFTATAVYDLNDQFVVKATVYSASARFGATPIPNGVDDGKEGLFSQKMRGYVDSNLALEYRYTKKISAFIELNNITGGKYQRWYKYQVQPFMALGGFTYSF